MSGLYLRHGVVHVRVPRKVRIVKITKTLRLEGLLLVPELNNDITTRVFRRKSDHKSGEHSWRFLGTISIQ